MESACGGTTRLELQLPDRPFTPTFQAAARIVIDECGDRLQRIEQFDLTSLGKVPCAVHPAEQPGDTILKLQKLQPGSLVETAVTRRS
ncbi:hypothetical protein AO715_01950 [Xanthomonas sp. Mitacek01]|nr:hypothetical protein AO715_01950 [Xanthomonas sp. Mitacek01]